MAAHFHRRPSLWLTTPCPNPSTTLRFFCFPYGGGSASIYYPWATAFGESVEVSAIQLPGRSNRIAEAPMFRVEHVVPQIVDAIGSRLDKPFALFGHSMGAILGFEVARYLRHSRLPLPKHMFVSGRRAPQIPDTDPPLHQLGDAEFIAQIRSLNGTPAEVLENPELLELILPTLRADTEMVETYRYAPEPPLDCSITAFGGDSDEETEDGRLEAWGVQTSARFSAHTIPGDHFFIKSNEDFLLGHLRRELRSLTLHHGAF
jgi:medium-chain acyl-[acyl-carrier-protein] hydrolase